MPTLSYTGSAGRRILRESDGLSKDIDVRRGESVDVSKKDADRLLEIGGFELVDAGQDHEAAPTGPADNATPSNEGG